MNDYLKGAAIVSCIVTAVGVTVNYISRHSPPPPPKVVSVIGLGACNKWLGGIAITSDGVVHGSNDMTSEQAVELAKNLPKDHSMLAMAPCTAPPGINTRG